MISKDQFDHYGLETIITPSFLNVSISSRLQPISFRMDFVSSPGAGVRPMQSVGVFISTM
jgi:hypothetical protein